MRTLPDNCNDGVKRGGDDGLGQSQYLLVGMGSTRNEALSTGRRNARLTEKVARAQTVESLSDPGNDRCGMWKRHSPC
jgi:hypothetical protein